MAVPPHLSQNMKAILKHGIFISFFILVLWPIMSVFMHFAQETLTLFATEPRAFCFLIFFVFSLTILSSLQVVCGVLQLWPVTQSLLLILIFDQAKQYPVANFQVKFPILKFPRLSGGFYLKSSQSHFFEDCKRAPKHVFSLLSLIIQNVHGKMYVGVSKGL